MDLEERIIFLVIFAIPVSAEAHGEGMSVHLPWNRSLAIFRTNDSRIPFKENGRALPNG